MNQCLGEGPTNGWLLRSQDYINDALLVGQGGSKVNLRLGDER